MTITGSLGAMKHCLPYYKFCLLQGVEISTSFGCSLLGTQHISSQLLILLMPPCNVLCFWGPVSLLPNPPHLGQLFSSVFLPSFLTELAKFIQIERL